MNHQFRPSDSLLALGTASVPYFLFILIAILFFTLSKRGGTRKKVSVSTRVVLASLLLIGASVLQFLSFRSPSAVWGRGAENMDTRSPYFFYIIFGYLSGTITAVGLAIWGIFKLLKRIAVFRNMSRVRFTGVLITTLSLVLCIYALAMSTSVYGDYGRVNNMGLMNNRTTLIIFGGFLLLVGVLLMIIPSGSGPKKEAQPVTAHQNASAADELVKLVSLKEKGVLSQEEFDLQKKKVLSA